MLRLLGLVIGVAFVGCVAFVSGVVAGAVAVVVVATAGGGEEHDGHQDRAQR